MLAAPGRSSQVPSRAAGATAPKGPPAKLLPSYRARCHCIRTWRPVLLKPTPSAWR